MYYNALNHWSKFQTNVTTFQWVTSKNRQKLPKIVLSAGMETFEITKLENYLINSIRILYFIWDLELVLFYSHKDVVSGIKFIF